MVSTTVSSINELRLTYVGVKTDAEISPKGPLIEWVRWSITITTAEVLYGWAIYDPCG